MSARRAPTWHPISILGVAAALVLAGPVGQADAVVTGLARVSPFTPTTSAAKSLTATCPPGTRVVGPGGDTTPGNGSVVLNRIRPEASLTSVTLHADEDEVGTPESWFLQAFVVCAAPPPGLELVSATSASTSANKSVVATCPSGKRLLGNGAAIIGAPGQVLLDGQLPNGQLTSVTANAVEDETGTSAAWRITAYAICANAVTGLQRVTVASAVDSDNNRIATAPCPTGKSVIGMGGTINGQGVLDAVFPDIPLTSANITAFEDATGNAGNWSVTAYSICAASAELVASTGIRQELISSARAADCVSGRLAAGAGIDTAGGTGRVAAFDVIPARSSPTFSYAGAHTVSGQTADSWNISAQAICATAFPNQAPTSAASVNDSETEKSATVTCPAGLRVIGAGGGINGGDPTLVPANLTLETVRPNSALTGVTATAHETEGGTASNWTLNAYAVCASRPAGLRRVKTSSAPGSDEFAQTTATCPAGTHLIGTGGEVVGGAGEVVLDDLRADTALTKTTVTGFEDHTGLDSDWHMTAYAICIKR